MFSVWPDDGAGSSVCHAAWHAGLKEFPWPLYADRAADLSAAEEADRAVWVRDCAAAAENILPGHDAVGSSKGCPSRSKVVNTVGP